MSANTMDGQGVLSSSWMAKEYNHYHLLAKEYYHHPEWPRDIIIIITMAKEYCYCHGWPRSRLLVGLAVEHCSYYHCCYAYGWPKSTSSMDGQGCNDGYGWPMVVFIVIPGLPVME